MKPLVVDPLELVITGVGGQGNVLASQVLGAALVKAGYHVIVGETYGLSQRGGVVMSMVRVTDPGRAGSILGPVVPENRASVIMGLEPVETLRTLPAYGHPQVTVITNDRPLLPINVASGANRYPDLGDVKDALTELSGRLYWLPASTKALELGNPILANVILLGALAGSGMLPLDLPEIEAALADIFPEKKMNANRQALAAGREMANA
jgi:indolepyruvate ferredoxin oxidoreductase beta subunit